MSSGAAVNASPLIYLARIARLDLLDVLPRPIVVPEAVTLELAAGVPPEPAMAGIADAGWIEASTVRYLIPASIRAWDLGAGESAVLAWALAKPGTLAVIDDLQGRRCAASLGVPVMGTLAVVLAAKRLGRLSAIHPVVRELAERGMYPSESLIHDVLAIAGE